MLPKTELVTFSPRAPYKLAPTLHKERRRWEVMLSRKYERVELNRARSKAGESTYEGDEKDLTCQNTREGNDWLGWEMEDQSEVQSSDK